MVWRPIGGVCAAARGFAGRSTRPMRRRVRRESWSRSWRSARGWRERGEPREGGGELVGPGPVAIEVQDRLAGVEGEAAGDVQQPVAQALGFAAGELAVEAEVLGPGDQVL